MECKNCGKESRTEVCEECLVLEKRTKFVWLAFLTWFVSGFISSALLDTNSPKTVFVELNNIFSLNGVAVFLGDIVGSGIVGFIVCGIGLLFIKKLRSLRSFWFSAAVVNVVFSIILVTS